MRKILIVGYGDIGKRFAARYASQFSFSVICRTKIDDSSPGMHSVNWLNLDLDAPNTLRRLAGLSDDVIYLAPPNPNGLSDKRVRNFLRSISSGDRIPQRILYMSTTGVYGDCSGDIVREARVVNPQTDRAIRRLDAETQVRDWSKNMGCMSVVLRVPGIYASDRLPLKRLLNGLPALTVSEDSYSNHIHAEDLVRIIFFALIRGKNGRIYNCADDSRIKVGEYFDLVADRFGLPQPQRVTRSEAKRVLPDMSWSFLRESRLISNDRMKSELGVRLAYPTVNDGVPHNTRLLNPN
ncbi:NAD-dependent epimerase/dehydratase family protein [Burkholderiales bacterium]|nr:NAD-dependent epimerase/dehydratase family protein [Burkholderiales bacterium]